ncbi:MAG: hypothetical protein PHX34_02780 [Candidatus Shapirobacteria bacterium]|nr:hypothetical protein [Candidatus Shapirobacteria bacterium]
MDPTNKLLADVTYQTLEGPGIVPDTNPASQVETIISTVFGILTIVAVIYFIFQIIFAGYGFLSSQGNEEKIKTARDRLTNGILGLTIVVVAFGVGVFLANLLGLGDIFNLSNFIGSSTP